MLKRFLIAFAIVAILVGGFFYIYYKVGHSNGSFQDNKIFTVNKGEGNATVSKNLERAGLVSNNWYFYLYIRTHGLVNHLYPGQYLLSGKMSIPEIAAILTNPKKAYEKVTLIEGWTAKQMADELTSHGFDGGAFLDLVKNPPREITAQFAVLSSLPAKTSLEGYLFPDTYYISKDATPEGILKKILNNTDAKINSDVLGAAKSQNKNFFQVLTLASILEKEVKTDDDRAIVSGIFWNRLQVGQALQSDATLTYILGDKNAQHSGADLATNSPYNTYLYKGLPPGPISNPGLAAILAALHPQNTDYNYFLSTKDGQTIFAKNYAEQVANKAKYGL